MEIKLSTPKVLSIQSHVSHGYVGNRAATFPLQCLGWDVDALNSVNFSNHTGYGLTQGAALEADQLAKMYAKLKDLRINEYNCVLTGYVPNKELLDEVLKIVKDLKSTREIFWLMDPVMGDNGVMYVQKTVVSAYQSLVASGLVDAVTPNLFEAGLLVGFEVNSKDLVSRALDVLHHTHGVKNVVITSISFEDEPHRLFSVCSTAGKPYKLIEIRPIIEGYFTGVGDLTSALVMDKIYKYVLPGKRQLDEVVADVIRTVNKVLQVTKLKAEQESGMGIGKGQINDAEMKYRELRIIESRRFFLEMDQEENA